MHGDWEWFRVDGTRMRSGIMDRGRWAGTWTTCVKSGVPYKDTDMGMCPPAAQVGDGAARPFHAAGGVDATAPLLRMILI